ncbi:MmgE/PrpD family protein [Afifella sp. IM 167]|uniref:MmgE/PrpD family protein n=1 Tax=Afifella sp. IM 167 TaxID=2033586 RepID=UPI001CCB7017|nr:MmgE/PrpD family protein [Afifella sp. IM 167]
MIARQALAADLAALPAAAVEKAKTCLLDFLSCAMEARDLPWSRQAVAIATPVAGGAAILASERRATPGEAAFANAVLGHGLVREDMHAGAIAHLGVVVWPVLLALAGSRKISGADMLAAAIAGYEVGGRLGRALMTTEIARLFRPTGLVGPMAGAMAGCRLLATGEEIALSAFSLAANTSGGLNEWPHHGGSEMYFHPGFAARSAVTAIGLARAGALASPSILEGEAGLFAAFRRAPMEGAITLFPEGESEIEAVFNKPVPACNFAQSPCQAALAAIERVAGGSSAVERVEIATSEAAVRYPGCDAFGPFERALQAKMSIPFGVAAAIAAGEIAEANYARLGDAEIARLIGATTLTADAAFTAAFPQRQGARVTLHLKDGTEITEELDDVVFATPELVRSRFMAAAGDALGAGRAEEIAAFVDGLEGASDAGALARLAALPEETEARP